VLALAGCGPDAGQLLQCERVLMALAGDVTVLRGEATAGEGHEVVLPYENTAGRQSVRCRFAGGAFAAGRLELVGVSSSEAGDLGPAALAALKQRLER
jgi:hypothetical protein